MRHIPQVNLLVTIIVIFCISIIESFFFGYRGSRNKARILDMLLFIFILIGSVTSEIILIGYYLPLRMSDLSYYLELTAFGLTLLTDSLVLLLIFLSIVVNIRLNLYIIMKLILKRVQYLEQSLALLWKKELTRRSNGKVR